MRFSKIFNHKFLLNCCNLVFMGCGSVLLFSGFYLFSDTQRILLSRLLTVTSDQLNELPQPLFYYIALGLGAAGTIAILASIIGFWASCLNTYCFLSLYFLAVVSLLLIESAVCLAITIWPQCLGLNFDETKMVKSLQGYYGVPSNEQFTIAMDLAQVRFNCCGMNSDINYDTSLWRIQGYGQRDWTVPLTCCKLENRGDRFSYLDPKPKNLSLCQTLQKFDFEKARHTDSCLEKLDLWYREQYVIFLGASVIIALVEFCVLLSIILNCTRISSKRRATALFQELSEIHNYQQQQLPHQFETNSNNSCILHEDNNMMRINRSMPALIENIYETDKCDMQRTTSGSTSELLSQKSSPSAAKNGSEMMNKRSIITTTMPNVIPTAEIKEIYVQPENLYKNKHNTTFRPASKKQYHISRSYLV